MKTQGTGHHRVLPARVLQHQLCIPPEPLHIRPLHRRLPARGAERRLIQRQDVLRERERSVPATNYRARNGESSGSSTENFRFQGQTSQGDVSIYPF